MATAMQVTPIGAIDASRTIAELDIVLSTNTLPDSLREMLTAKRARLSRREFTPEERHAFSEATAATRHGTVDAELKLKLELLDQFKDAGAFSAASRLVPRDALSGHPREAALIRQAHKGIAMQCAVSTFRTYLPYWRLWATCAAENGFPLHAPPPPGDPTRFEDGLGVFALERAEGNANAAKTAVSKVRDAVGFVHEFLNGLPRPADVGVVSVQHRAVMASCDSAPHQMRPLEPWMCRRGMETWGCSEEPGKRLIANSVNIGFGVLNRFSDINRTDNELTMRMESPVSPTPTYFYYVWRCRKNKKHVFYIPVAIMPGAQFSVRKSFLAMRELTGLDCKHLMCNVQSAEGRLVLDTSKAMSYETYSRLFRAMLHEIGVPASALETRAVPGSKRKRRLMNTQSVRAGGASHLDVLKVPRDVITARGGWKQEKTMLLYSRSQMAAHLAASRALQL